MVDINEVYRCEVCGNIVEVLHVGGGVLACCDQPMFLLIENTVDASTEKHVPVIEKVDGGVKVLVGQVPHPMEDEHYIEWIEVIDGDRVLRQNLKPHQAPEAIFKTTSNDITARAYCNLHGFWVS